MQDWLGDKSPKADLCTQAKEVHHRRPKTKVLLMECKAGPADGPHQTCVAPCPELLSADAGASLHPLPACVAGTWGLLNDRSGTDVSGCGQAWGWWSRLQALKSAIWGVNPTFVGALPDMRGLKLGWSLHLQQAGRNAAWPCAGCRAV